jgi:tripartite-type tricarboxylate transporter receptor subunit TctC
MNTRFCAIAAAAVALPILAAGAAHAQDAVQKFYSGRSMDLVIGYPPGGGFDSSARLLMRHMPRHIPGSPTMIAKNMPGAGSLVAANYLYNVAPKDGSEFGIIGGSVPFGPLWSREGVSFEATRFNWIGSMDRWNGIVLLWKGAQAKTLDDLRKMETPVGATGAGDVTAIYPRVLNALIGTRFRVVGGYRGTTDLNLAIERGEVAGRLGWCWDCVKAEKPNWVSEKQINIPLQLGLQKHPELDAPMAMDLVKDEESRQIMRLVFGSQEMARPFVAPPGVPADRMAALRKAFDETLRDKEFLAEATKMNLPINAASWSELEKLLKDVYATPAPIVERAAKIVGGK